MGPGGRAHVRPHGWARRGEAEAEDGVREKGCRGSRRRACRRRGCRRDGVRLQPVRRVGGAAGADAGSGRTQGAAGGGRSGEVLRRQPRQDQLGQLADGAGRC